LSSSAEKTTQRPKLILLLLLLIPSSPQENKEVFPDFYLKRTKGVLWSSSSWEKPSSFVIMGIETTKNQKRA
jgi:hypothetical protein